MAAPTTEGAPGPARPACQNCGAPLLGEHCYACGQPVKGLVRHFSSIVGDFVDSVFNIDARVFRTLGPLFARPGYLSLQYFEGHRVRFVSPVRLFVFLSIVTFFVAQFTLDFGDAKVGFDNDGTTNDAIQSAKTVQGSNVAISAMGGKVTVDGANVVKTDIGASNGVIHVIDTVILPKK